MCRAGRRCTLTSLGSPKTVRKHRLFFYLSGSKTPRCHRPGPTLRTSTTRRSREQSSWLSESFNAESAESAESASRTSSSPRLSRAEAGSASGGTPDTKSSTLRETRRPPHPPHFPGCDPQAAALQPGGARGLPGTSPATAPLAAAPLIADRSQCGRVHLEHRQLDRQQHEPPDSAAPCMNKHMVSGLPQNGLYVSSSGSSTLPLGLIVRKKAREGVMPLQACRESAQLENQAIA